MAASGILIGVVLIGLAAFGLVGRFGRWIPSTVMHGIQLGVGLYLAWAGVGLLAADALVGGAALLFLLLVSVTRFKPLAALALLLIAVAWGLTHAPPGAAALRLSPALPTFGLPDLRGRVPIHAGSGPGLTPRRLGAKAGSERRPPAYNGTR